LTNSSPVDRSIATGTAAFKLFSGESQDFWQRFRRKTRVISFDVLTGHSFR
jgi:hypothetical protein